MEVGGVSVDSDHEFQLDPRKVDHFLLRLVELGLEVVGLCGGFVVAKGQHGKVRIVVVDLRQAACDVLQLVASVLVLLFSFPDPNVGIVRGFVQTGNAVANVGRALKHDRKVS